MLMLIGRLKKHMDVSEKYKSLFDFLSNEYGIIATITEMDEIIHESLRVANSFDQFIEYCEEKPKESGLYFVKGKKDYKAVAEYNLDTDEWDLKDLPINYFSNENIRYLK
jgi:phage anti-repressor protein